MTPTAQVMIGVPNTGYVLAETERSLRDLLAATRCAQRIDVEMPIGSPVDVVRHRLVTAFLSRPDATHLFFVDSDMGLPPDALDRLLALDAPLACLPCPMMPQRSRRDRAGGGPSITTNVWQLLSSPQTPVRDRIVHYLMPDECPAEPFDCFGTGLACCLVRREVVARMDRPMFQFLCSDGYDSVQVGEDAFFFDKARALGYVPRVDPGAICEHFKEIDLTHFEEFFLDEPVPWTWHQGQRPAVPEPVFCACIAGPEGRLHTLATRFLASRARRTGDGARTFVADEWSRALKEAVRHFLAREAQPWLLLMDAMAFPPDDFIDRCQADGHPASIGLVRELEEGVAAYGAATKDSAGGWVRLDKIDLASPSPLDIDAASLRVALLHRDCLRPLGSGWIPLGATPFRAGASLIEASQRRRMTRPRLVPIGCHHYQVFGLRHLLEAKHRLRAASRGTGGTGGTGGTP